MSPSEIEDRAARYCHLYSVHPPVNPRTIATAQDFTLLPSGSAPPPRQVRGGEPLYHCHGRRGCPHTPDGCDERDQSWQVMLELARRELRAPAGQLVARHYERFARAVLLPADEFLEDTWLCRRSVARLFEVHCYAPVHVVRARLSDLGTARLSIVAV